ncbi:hypothetical protein J7T55_007540 [Diaporthe amygdali]|uniref:uncharacterized protein n=1 Tax=Phomopsis amygdali TaxID=1214568 RepID=UPI0022FE1974|nr:uncharacterized protein J7T55_007540 [Diaporthe amygdali]KAJ0116560.1 hypothetical protein J7T55_007540 [Diaporthe amygdali]
MGIINVSLAANTALDHVRRQSDRAPAQEGGLNLSYHSRLTTGVVLGCLATISVVIAIRLLVKKMMPPHHLSADDGLVLVATAFTLSFCMVSLGASMHGLGQHSADLIDAGIDVTHIIEFVWAGHILYSFAIAFAKLSIISSYFRIFPHHRLHKLMPPGIQPSDLKRHVTDFHPFSPLPYFLRLRLPRKQKVGACLLFIVGGSAVFASAVKLTYIHSLYNTSDIAYDLADPLMWSILECSISIVCLSMPSLRPLFAKLAPLIFFAGEHRQPRERSSITSFSDDSPRLNRITTHFLGSGIISDGIRWPLTQTETNNTSNAEDTGDKLVIIEKVVVEGKA